MTARTPIHQTIHLDPEGPEQVVIRRTCRWCKGTVAVIMDRDKFDEWDTGSFAQKVWPDSPAPDRETLISGTHSQCWEQMWEDDD